MKLILALAAITLLTACGGGGGDDSNNTQATTNTPQTPSPTLNDTGITWGGNVSGNSAACTSGVTITVPQDCHYGRDASLTLSVSTFTYATDGSKIAKVGAGAAGFDFTKLSSTGAILPASADSWSCVKDNITGLIWEVKTNTGSADTLTIDDGVRTYTGGNIHHEDNTYHWGGLSSLGREHANPKGTYYNDWDVLVNGSNSDSGLCGFTDWRVPTINELRSIVHNGKTTNPAIDTNYFPNTAASYFWSASPITNNSSNAWLFNFNFGNDNNFNRTNSSRVRLVRVGE